MEIIKKRISLEQFKSRIPSILDTFNLNKTPHDGSWGEIPHRVSLMGKYMKYGTMMNLYYRLIKLLMKLEFKQYDSLGTKWLDIKCDWRDLLDSSNNLRQKLRIVQELPESIDATLIVSIISETDYTLFFDEVRAALGNDDYDGIDYIIEVHRIVGRIVVPKTITGVFVPYMIWITDIPDIIVFMKALKLEADNNCCYIEKYKAYGGDDFLEFLEGYEVPVKPTKKCPYCEWTTDEIPNRTNAFEKHLFDEHNKTLEDYLKEHEEDRDYFPLLSIDIPILLTANLIDLGLTKTDDISEELTINVNTGVTLTPKIVTGVNGESKLLTLRRRKRSIDDNGVELPFIYKPLFNESGTIIDETTETPFKEGYIKNVQMFNNKYYGDVIASMEEIEAEDETLTIQITYAIGARLKK
jgi:hypothetical protein